MNTSRLFASGTLGGDFLITLASGVALIAGVLILYGLIARVMGIEALGEFLLVRRTAFSLMGVLLIGMNIGLPYYTAQGGGQEYGATALAVFLLLSLPLIGVSTWALSSGKITGFPENLSLPFAIFTSAYAMQLLTFGLLRGQMKIWGANILQLIGTGLIPLGAFLLVKDQKVPDLIISMGIATLVMSSLVYLSLMRLGGNTWKPEKARQLLSYGGQRLPGFAAEFVVLGGVPLLILGSSGRTEVAYVIAGISLVRLFLVAVGPLGVVLLPRISRATVQGNLALIAQGLEALTRTTFMVGIPLALLLSMNGSTILQIWLGADNETGAWVIRSIVLSLPFYLLIVLLRSPIDAASVKGYNTVVYGLAAVSLLGTFYGLRAIGIATLEAGIASFVVAHVAGAAASLYFAHRFYGINIMKPWYLLTVIGVLGGSSAAFYSIRAAVPGPISLLWSTLALVAILAFYFTRSRSDWVVGLRAMVVSR